ncbi:hypothetical protein G7Z99_06430 [Pseudomonas entomophila]|nr:hypothetical protein [Pseudomonas entomophila]
METDVREHGEYRAQDDEVTDMALVGKRDGRNFGYGRQLSYAGPQVLKTCSAAVTTAR